jgi:hypothetical protein
MIILIRAQLSVPDCSSSFYGITSLLHRPLRTLANGKVGLALVHASLAIMNRRFACSSRVFASIPRRYCGSIAIPPGTEAGGVPGSESARKLLHSGSAYCPLSRPGLLGPLQSEIKSGSPVGLRLGPDRASVLLNDPLHGGQSDSGSFKL